MTISAKNADAHHVPCVIVYSIDHVVCGGGNCTAQGPCYYKGITPTLKSGETHAVAVIHDEKNACS